MKKIIFSSIVAIAFLTSCGNTKTSGGKTDSMATPAQTGTTPANSGSQIAGVKYQCPMQCEGTKTYDKPGKCPQCGMEMKEVK